MNDFFGRFGAIVLGAFVLLLAGHGAIHAQQGPTLRKGGRFVTGDGFALGLRRL